MSVIVDAMIEKIIGVVIVISILTSLGTMIITNTATGTGKPLENASASSKSMYSIIEFLYPIIGVMIMVGVGMSYKKK